jgi:hypothetical protein
MAFQLKLSTAMTNLMPQDDPMVQEFDRVMEEFAGAASMLVVAEGNEQALVAFAERVAPQIEAIKDYVKKVDYKLPRDFLTKHALMLMKAEDLKNNHTLFENPNVVGFLTNLNDSFEREYTGSGGGSIEGQEQEQGVIRFMDGLQTFLTDMNQALDGDGATAGVHAAEAILYGDPYYRSWDRRMLIMQIIPTFDFLEIDKDIAATDTVEVIVKQAAQELGIQAGLTGMVPLSRDEMVAVSSDSYIITTIALVGILVLFIVAFRMLVSPLLAILTLLVGVTWAMGLAWPLVRTLNMMTSMMGVVLVGLGIDFSIHIIAMYSEMRARGESVADALHITLQKSGLGVITGGLTTAAAFLTMLVTRTQGYREFGLTLGVGIIMTMVAALTVLPTLLVLKERLGAKMWRSSRKPPAPRDISYRFLGRRAVWLARHPGLAIAGIVILIAFVGYRGAHITMDYNYLNMEPIGLESVELQKKMIKKLNLSADYAFLTTSSLEEAHRLTKAAKEMSTSGMVQSIIDFLPASAEQEKRREYIGAIYDRLSSAPITLDFNETQWQRLLEEITRLEMNVMEVQDMSILGGQDKVYLKTGLLVGVVPDTSLADLQKILATVNPKISTGILSRLRQRLEQAQGKDMQGLRDFQRSFAQTFKPVALQMANTEELTLDMIPQTIRDQYVGKSGNLFLITVFPKANVWNTLFLDRFTKELQEVSDRATGIPPVWKRLIDLFAEDGKLATGLALAVIFLILLGDFRTLRKASLALVPLVIGTIWMLGTMELTGLQITMVNIMAIPLIIGIGIDDGVHIIHRYQIEGRDQHKTVFASTGRAILLTSLTTMLGFGSLTFATYRGLGSMGSALFIGVGTCFLATILVIPAIMGIVERVKGKKENRMP